MDIKVWTRLILFLLVFYSILGIGQIHKEVDPTVLFKDQFYKLHLLNFSDDGKWLTARKQYDNNNDTVMVFQTYKKPYLLESLAKFNNFSFIANKYLWASGNEKAVLWDLYNDKKLTYSNVQKSGVLKNNKLYFLIDTQDNLSMFDLNNKLRYQIPDVKQYYKSKENDVQLIHVQKAATAEILLLGSQPEVLYRTVNTIVSISISPSKKYVIVTESDKKDNAKTLTFIKLSDRKVYNQRLPHISNEAYLNFSEITSTDAFVVYSMIKKKKSENIVDIWYSNDGNLEAKQQGEVKYNYYLWEERNNSLIVLPNDKFSSLVQTNNLRYYIVFNKDELQNYKTQFPDLKVSLYDTVPKSYIALDVIQPEICLSAQGDYFTYLNTENKWILYDFKMHEKRVIGEKLRNPIFSSDQRYVYFESDDDYWVYNITTNKLNAMNVAHGQQSLLQIDNREDVFYNSGYNFFRNALTEKQPIVLKILNNKDNSSHYVRMKDKTLDNISLPSNDAIYGIVWSPLFDKFVYLQENHNKPTQITFSDIKEKGNTTVFSSNVLDTTAASLRKDIVPFGKSAEIDLKGILYYPNNFDANKKYPMIVHVYQRQSYASNRYLSPLDNFPVGFNIRTMLAKGYFVYLPDVITDSTGVGCSALNNIYQSLDALVNHKNIDAQKIGLIGHSFGGYITNFIATQSERFATYISGAGASDIIRTYFSYNYTSNNPFYWQFESGQYKMGVSYADNKALYYNNNPIYNVDKVKAPILLWAGMQDKRIDWGQVMSFYIGLKRHNKEVIALFYPKQAHVFEKRSKESDDLSKRIVEWFDYFLKDNHDVPWIEKQIKILKTPK